jgi:hypothetical protein
MLEYCNDNLKKMTFLNLMPVKKNITITQLSIFPEPNIPMIQYSNSPIVSEANYLVQFSGCIDMVNVIIMLVPERKLSFPSISASDSNFNPRNTTSIPVVKIFVFLDLNKKS